MCLNDTTGTRNILHTTNHQHSKYWEKFNKVKEGKKSGPEIAYRRKRSYGSSAFELSRFHCIFNLYLTQVQYPDTSGPVVGLFP